MSDPRKRKLIRVLAWVLALLLVGSAVFSGVISVAFSEELAPEQKYSVKLTQTDASAYSVECEITYTNNTGASLSGVVFSMYANRLKREESLAADTNELSETYYAGYTPGGVEIYTVKVNGEEAKWGFEDTYEEYILVECELAPGASAVFGFEYTLLLNENRGPTGYSVYDVRLTGFLPGLTVYGEHGFAENAVSGIDRYAWEYTANYCIDMKLLSWYRPACAGITEQVETADGMTVWHAEAEGVREFALVLSGRYRSTTVESDMGTRITLYASDRAGARKAADSALKAMNMFETWFGRAAVSDISIAESDIVSGILDFGGMILISRNDISDPEYDVVYGLARGFMGIDTGNDPTEEPWLSVAIPQFLYYRYIEELKGTETMLTKLNNDCLADLLVTLSASYDVTYPLTAFNSKKDHDIVLLHRGAAAVYQIREDMGDEAFLNGLALYHQRFSGSTSDAQDMKDCMSEAAGRSCDLLIDDWLDLISDYQGQLIDEFR